MLSTGQPSQKTAAAASTGSSNQLRPFSLYTKEITMSTTAAADAARNAQTFANLYDQAGSSELRAMWAIAEQIAKLRVELAAK